MKNMHSDSEFQSVFGQTLFSRFFLGDIRDWTLKVNPRNLQNQNNICICILYLACRQHKSPDRKNLFRSEHKAAQLVHGV